MVNILDIRHFFLYAALGLLYLVIGIQLAPIWAGFFKILPILILGGLVVTSKGIGRIKPLLLAALSASMLGDIILLNEDKTAVQLGMLAFASAHIINISILWPQWQYRKNMLLEIAAIACLPLLGYGLLLPNMQGLALPALCYLGLLLTLVWCTLGVQPRQNPLILGSLLFLCSDNILGIELFYWKENKIFTLVMLTYYLAQWFLYFGLIQAERARS